MVDYFEENSPILWGSKIIFFFMMGEELMPVKISLNRIRRTFLKFNSHKCKMTVWEGTKVAIIWWLLLILLILRYYFPWHQNVTKTEIHIFLENLKIVSSIRSDVFIIYFTNEDNNLWVKYLTRLYEAFHAKSDGLKNFNLGFPSFFDIF